MTTKAATPQQGGGFIYILSCFLIWGLFPLYWRPLNGGPMAAGEILAWRIVFSAVFAWVILWVTGKHHDFLRTVASHKTLIVFFASGMALGLNWLIYLWAVTHEHVLNASLGYFMTPLLTVLCGRIFLAEKLYPIQFIAVMIAVLGLIYLTVLHGQLPLVSVGLGVSFAIYGLLRKIAPLDALSALVLETLMMLPFALVALAYWGFTQNWHWQEIHTLGLMVLIGSGIATTVPLLLFAVGAKRMTLANLGMMQYISPTMQFILGWWFFNEAFDLHRFIGYAMVWVAVAVYVYGSLNHHQYLTERPRG